MERFRDIVACAFSAIFGALSPIHSIIQACMIIFAANFIAGIAAGAFVQHERFSLRKAFNCILEAAIITTLIAMILVIGDKIANHNGAMSAISVVVYALIYFYGVNILKNLSRIFPGNKLIDFLYYVLSFEVVERIPYLSQYKSRIGNYGPNNKIRK